MYSLSFYERYGMYLSEFRNLLLLGDIESDCHVVGPYVQTRTSHCEAAEFLKISEQFLSGEWSYFKQFEGGLIRQLHYKNGLSRAMLLDSAPDSVVHYRIRTCEEACYSALTVLSVAYA